jgi:AAA+ superfamily predicted ATPase
MERIGVAGDSGASQAVFAAFLTALSDGTKRGRSLLVGTTNDPNKMSDAMRSRFTVIPVISPLKEDFPEIVATIGLRAGAALDANDARIQQAAATFFEKGANPRKIREALDNAILLHEALTPETVLFAAHDLCTAEDRLSTIHADLVAISATSLRSFLPWSENPATYPFPD